MPAEDAPHIPIQRDALEVQLDTMPDDLRPYPQWICWRYVEREAGRKPDKQPVNPWNLHNAGVHWPNTWSTFPHPYMTYLMYRNRGVSGIGFVLTAEDPFVGLDLDHCIDQGKISMYAETLLGQVSSYTEVSPSGTGLRILAVAPGFTANARRSQMEIYSRDRFLTITGNHLAGTPTTIQSLPIERITALTSREPDAIPARPSLPTEAPIREMNDAQLWEGIFVHDRFGDQHRRRFLGDTSLDGGDHSLTVIRLLNCLARWTQCDAARMRAMLLSSSLANDKWVTKRGAGDWLDYQIADAIRYMGKHGIE